MIHDHSGECVMHDVELSDFEFAAVAVVDVLSGGLAVVPLP